ncbi:Protein CBG25676 [Caenorhabditis briggsae]|uniref:Protein CBG25676 n=3 Tax=Caenorhabditis briggsae TaxID=6238 RepID=B6ILM1_CAEBR|nr:Protein CBG25676 [Caenorhabditis briggsae]ULU07470.1 hypothetical protein L3Y34_018886 [Caenorhabditis briggsae]CAS00801.1 Protein CBG25676 [Caenorhabditis briggsae]
MDSTLSLFSIDARQPFDSPGQTSESNLPISSDVDSSGDSEAEISLESVKKRLKNCMEDLDLALDASVSQRKRAEASEAKIEEMQGHIDTFNEIVASIRKGRVAAINGMQVVEYDDLETIINMTIGRVAEDFDSSILDHPSTTSDNLKFLNKLTEDIEHLISEINKVKCLDRENMSRISALESCLETTRRKFEAEKLTLFATVEKLQNKLHTVERSNESLRLARKRADTLESSVDFKLRFQERSDEDQRKIQQLQKELAEKESLNSILSAELNFIKPRHETMEKLVNQHITTIGALTWDNKTLKHRLTDNEELRRKHDALHQDYNRLQADYKSLERTHRLRTRDHEEEIEKLRNRSCHHENDQKKLIEKLSRQNKKLEKQLTEMENDATKQKKLYSGLQEQNEELKEELKKKNQEIEGLKENAEPRGSCSAQPKLRLVSDSARNSPLLMRTLREISDKNVKMENLGSEPEFRNFDDSVIVVTKRVLKRERDQSSPVKTNSKMIRI